MRHFVQRYRYAFVAALPLLFAACNRVAPSGESETMTLLRERSEKVCVADDVRQTLRDLIVPKAADLTNSEIPIEKRIQAVAALDVAYEATTRQSFDTSVPKVVCDTTVRITVAFGPADDMPAPVDTEETRAPEVRVSRGDIHYVGADGRTIFLTRNGDNDEPVLSPDGRTVAFIHVDRRATEDASGTTSLWIADVESRTTRRLLASRPDTDEPKRNLAFFQRPRFSLDGGFVYIDADAWATSNAVHQVNVQTGAERFVTDGATLGVIRDGPYQGHLLVSQHRYRKAGGSYDPVSIIRPDGTVVLEVPGTDGDGDAEVLVTAWLKRNGWQAW